KKMLKYLSILIIIQFSVFSQSPDWIDIITDDVQIDARGYRVWVADVNGDQYPDLLWGGDVGGTNNHIHLMLNQQNPESQNPKDRIFVDVSKSSGIQTSRITDNENRIADVAALGDVDNDGDMDLITSIYTHRLQNYSNNDQGDRTELLLNDGNGNFTIFENSGLNTIQFDESIEAGMTNVSSICFLDYNKDGNLDVYFGTWFTNYVGSAADIYMPNILMKGNGDGTFDNVGPLGVREPLYGATVFDWNNDGWTDIATSSYCRTPSKLYMNLGGEFVDATELSNYNTQRLGGDHGQNLCQWEALPGDFDNDGDLDLLEVKVHGGYNAGEGRTTITTNGGEENDYLLNWDLSRINRIVNMESHIGDMGGVWMDWNNDGLLDIMIGQDGYLNANPQGGVRLFFMIQDENHVFNEVTPDLDILPAMEETHSMEAADFDLDGDLDLFAASKFTEVIVEDGEEKTVKYNRIELLENKIGNKNYWIAIKPKLEEGLVYNGTRIEVYRGDEILTREIQQGGGHFGYQQPITQYFGLGETSRIDSVIIKYNGTQNKQIRFGSITANKSYLLGENNIEILTTNYDNSNGILDVAGSNDMGLVNVGETDNHVIEYTNNSDKSISLNDILIDGDNEISLAEKNYNSILASGETGTIEIEFTPSERNYYSSVITIDTDANNGIDGQFKIEVFGNGFEEKPIAASLNNELVFDPIFIGLESSSVTTIRNAGELPLTISNITLSDSEGFDLDVTLPLTILAGETFEIPVIFTPTRLGNYNSEIIIESNGYKTETLTISLSANSNGPNPIPAIVGFPIKNFGTVNVGSTETLSIEIENTGNGDFIINEIVKEENESAFTFPTLDLPLNVQANSMQEIVVEFIPIKEESYSDILTFDANIENDLKVSVRGNGLVSSVNQTINGNSLAISVQPNPIQISSTLFFDYGGIKPIIANMFICDIDGRFIHKSNGLMINPGSSKLNIDFSILEKGVYFLVVQTDGGQLQYKIIK
ncbi:FG-GAP-like repeat-containing protein, partial [Candidatus Kapabacteria bacterium]|nr:FG-GAP-like repeat-containing protein [Candidatus Kapabacteria bacterium]